MATQKNICGLCNTTFDTEAKYLDHTCSITGFTPKDADHQGAEFKAISEASVARGEARKILEAKGFSPDTASMMTSDVDVARKIVAEHKKK